MLVIILRGRTSSARTASGCRDRRGWWRCHPEPEQCLLSVQHLFGAYYLYGAYYPYGAYYLYRVHYLFNSLRFKKVAEPPLLFSYTCSHLVLSDMLKCRLSKWLLDHPMTDKATSLSRAKGVRQNQAAPKTRDFGEHVTSAPTEIWACANLTAT